MHPWRVLKTKHTALEKIKMQKILTAFSTIIADQQKMGNMGPACFDHITEPPSDSLVDHIRLQMQEASLSRNPFCVLRGLIFFFFFNSTLRQIRQNRGYQLQKGATLPVLIFDNVGHTIFGRNLCKLTLLWQGILRSPQPEFFVYQYKLNELVEKNNVNSLESSVKQLVVCRGFFQSFESTMYGPYIHLVLKFSYIVHILVYLKVLKSSILFSKHRPSGPMLSISQFVHMRVCVSVCARVFFLVTV